MARRYSPPDGQTRTRPPRPRDLAGGQPANSSAGGLPAGRRPADRRLFPTTSRSRPDGSQLIWVAGKGYGFRSDRSLRRVLRARHADRTRRRASRIGRAISRSRRRRPSPTGRVKPYNHESEPRGPARSPAPGKRPEPAESKPRVLHRARETAPMIRCSAPTGAATAKRVTSCSATNGEAGAERRDHAETRTRLARRFPAARPTSTWTRGVGGPGT